MHAPSTVSPTLQAALEAVLRRHFDAPDAWRSLPDPLHPLVDLVNALRRHRPRRPEAPAPLTALIELLERMPAHRAALAACVHAQVEGRSLRGALTDPGILAHSDLFGEVLRRVRKKLLPELPEEGSIQRLLVQLFYQRGDDRWLSRIPDDDARTLFRLLGGRAFRADGGDDGAYAEVLQAAVVLGHRVTGRAMEPELLRMVPDLDRYENPFLALQRELDDLQQRVHRDGQLIRTDDLDHRQLLVLLGQCMATIDQAFANSATQGISLRVNQSLLRMRQQLERMRVLLDLAAVSPEADAEDRTVALARTLAVINGGRNNIRDLLAESTQQVSFEITQHTGRTGEHYITSTAAEYRHMFLSAAGGGAIVACMCIVKVMLGLLHPPLFVKALLASLNYAAGFILIYLTGATLATKQPAMTAATLVRSLKEDPGGDYAAFAELFARLFRSQFVAFMGNVLLAFPVALGLVAGLHALTGFNVGGHAWLKLVNELNPVTSLALPHAAIAGVFLFLSGLIAGSVANTTRHERIPERIAEHPWLKRTVGTRGARRLADLYARRWAGIISNLWFGVFMGSTAAIGLFFGLPLDIRHITFAAGNLAIGLFGSGWQLGPWTLVWSVVGIGLIGFVNFAVSFGLSLSLAMRSRAIPYRDLSAILLAIGRHARHHPLRFLVPTRASVRAEVPNS